MPVQSVRLSTSFTEMFRIASVAPPGYESRSGRQDVIALSEMLRVARNGNAAARRHGLSRRRTQRLGTPDEKL